MTLPLEGYKVTDLGQVWAGPIVGHLLADMGADVIRIESAAGTDMMRQMSQDPSDIRKLMEAHFIHRNRRVVTLNFTKPRGVELAKEIIKDTDVVIENYSPRVLKGFGLNYEELVKVNPDLIMCSLSAGGQYGPYENLLGYGPSINSVSGVDSLVGYRDDVNLMVNLWDADPTAAVTGTYAIQVALHHKEKTGEGQYIDLSFYEALTTLVSEGMMDYTMNRRVAVPEGNRHPMMSPHGVYTCKGDDRWITIAVRTQDEWRALCKAMGEPAWCHEERFADIFGRLKNRDELDQLLGEWTKLHDDKDMMHSLQAQGVAAASVYTLEDIYHDPHDRHRRMTMKVDGPDLDVNEVIYGIPWHLSDTPGSLRTLTSPMGAHNKEIFIDKMGMPEDEMRRLVEEQVIY